MAQSLGRRLAGLRQAQGWTQQELADRLGISRVAISHFESDLALPSERTVILLGGLLRCEPQALVADTYYPLGKAMRLPALAPRYTEIEHQLGLLACELRWVARYPAERGAVQHEWRTRLVALLESCDEPRERGWLQAALAQIDALSEPSR